MQVFVAAYTCAAGMLHVSQITSFCFNNGMALRGSEGCLRGKRRDGREVVVESGGSGKS